MTVTRDIAWQPQVAPAPLNPLAATTAEERLLDDVATGRLPATARIWRSQSCLVVPASQAREAAFAFAAADLARAGWPVVTRRSGGSPVPLDPGMLNLSLVFPLAPGSSWQIDDGFHLLCDILIAALADLGLEARLGLISGAFCAGRFDLSIAGRKIAGTAQHWRTGQDADGRRRQAVLAHAVLLADPDLAAGHRALVQWHRHFDAATPNGQAITSLRLVLAGTAMPTDKLTSTVTAAILRQLCRRRGQARPARHSWAAV